MSGLQDEIRQAIRAEIQALRTERGGLMSWEAAAEYLGIRPRQMWDIQRREQFSVIRHSEGGRRYLKRAELDEYIERRSRRGGEAVA